MAPLLVLIKLFELLRGSLKEVYVHFSVLLFHKLHATMCDCFLTIWMVSYLQKLILKKTVYPELKV